MPQHAVSAGQDPVADAHAAEGQHNTLPARHEDAYTFSPPLAGNDVFPAVQEDVSTAGEGHVHPLTSAPAAAADSGEQCQDGCNDNIPAERALVVPESSTEVAVGRSAPTWLSKPVAAIGPLALLGFGAAAFAYVGFAEQTKVAPARMELASVPPSVAEADARAPQPSTAETNTRTIAVAPSSEAMAAAPAASAARPEPVLPLPAAPETAAAQPETAMQPPSAAPVAPTEPTPPRALTETVTPRPAAESRTAALPDPETPRPPAAIPNRPAAEAPPPPPPSRSAALAQPGLTRGQFAFVQRPGVNIRNAPSPSGEIVGSALMGGRFVVAGREGEWVQVAQGQWRGWINQRFLGPRLPREPARSGLF